MEAVELVTLRRQAGLWQYQLAALLDVPQSLICEMERARRPITAELEQKIRKALNEAQAAKAQT